MPRSLYRATTFARRPPTAGGEGRSHLGWLDWDQHAALLLDVRNLLAGKGHRLVGPPLASPNMPASEIDMLQRLRRP